MVAAYRVMRCGAASMSARAGIAAPVCVSQSGRATKPRSPGFRADALHPLTPGQIAKRSQAAHGQFGPAAYRAADTIHDLSTGEVFDYTRKRGVGHDEIVPPTEAARRDINWSRDRQALWNAAEAAENRSDSRVAREYELALPH